MVSGSGKSSVSDSYLGTGGVSGCKVEDEEVESSPSGDGNGSIGDMP